MSRRLRTESMDRSFGKRRVARRCWSLVLIACIFSIISIEFYPPNEAPATTAATPELPSIDRCTGRYIYMHDLPSKFNENMLRDCNALSKWTDMCRFTSNAGLGPPINNWEGVFSDTGWYATNQFALDVIFHNRMKHYDCLTSDSSLASAIYVPFYAGLDVARHLWGSNISVRDSASLDLIEWLKSRPEWAKMGGKDHFLVAGRITWDFRRLTDEESSWGSKLLLLPEAQNMTSLVIEASPWHGNDVGVPYPTYFHPSKESEIVSWQDRMTRLERPWLFSFAGAPRPNQTVSIRGRIIDQCHRSRRCELLQCDMGASKCHSPSSVMAMFQRSVFCLQPQGDSYTRRSAFDSMVAGCVPVFFHPGSAYVQYTWHLPRNYTRYSVFISEDEMRDGKVNIEEVLGRFSEEQVRDMREEVIRMLPRLIYSDPASKLRMKDAFHVAVEGVVERVERFRRAMKMGGFNGAFGEENSASAGLVKEHQWDHFFS